jgi:hypothetical protein
MWFVVASFFLTLWVVSFCVEKKKVKVLLYTSVGAGSFHHGLAFLTESLAEINEVLKWGQGKGREGKGRKQKASTSFCLLWKLLSFVRLRVIWSVY